MRKNALFIFIARFVKLLVGLFSVALSAKYFGISLGKDNWLIAISLITVIDATVWGALNEMFRTKFIFFKYEFGETRTLIMTKSLLFYILIFSSILSLVYFLSIDLIINSLKLDYTLSEFIELKTFIIYSIPFLIINQLTAIGSSILNAFNIFFISEFVGITAAILNLFVLYFIAPIIGVNAILISYYCSSLLSFFSIFYYLNFKLKINFFKMNGELKFSDFKIFYIASLPLFFNYLIGQLSNIYEKFMSVSYGSGILAILDYSRKFSDIFQGVLTSVLMTVMVPILSRLFVEKKLENFTEDFIKFYNLSIIGMTFIVSFFFSSSDLLVDIFYNKGSISSVALTKITRLMVIYGWSIFGVFHFMIFGLAYLSMGESKKFAFLSVITQLFSLSISFIYFSKFGIFIFPVSLALSHFIISLFFVLRFPIERLKVILNSIRYLIFLVSVSLTSYFFTEKVFCCQNNVFGIVIVNMAVIFTTMLVFGMIYRLRELKGILEYAKYFLFSR